MLNRTLKPCDGGKARPLTIDSILATKYFMAKTLSTTDHDRDAAGLEYVYPVVSRRAGGISIGVNLNTNNACNWRCIYCQVPDLQRGEPEPVDLKRLTNELRTLIEQVVSGRFYHRFNVAPAHRLLKDIALSGNGEPTSAREFPEVIKIVGDVLQEFSLAITPVVISNGSLMHRPYVKRGLSLLAALKGEVWFKIDRGTAESRWRVNSVQLSNELVLERLAECAALCRTKIQTCVFNFREHEDPDQERQAFVNLMAQVRQKTNVQTILLYAPSRQPSQPEAGLLESISGDMLEHWRRDLSAMGFTVNISA